MAETTYAWAPITKTVKEEDGTLLVYGPAASSALDRDQQRLDAAWLDTAMPRWMAEGGGVREQHDSKRAVGVGVGLSKGEHGEHMLTARIVDPVAVKKIEHGVLRGFSVGIKNPKVQMGKADAPNGLVVAGDVIEVSVVDRPANGECLFSLAKADAAGELQLVEDPQVVEKTDEPQAPAITLNLSGSAVSDRDLRDLIDQQLSRLVKADLSAAGRRKAAASGAAMEDGSYPITTKADLRKAIRAVGRGDASHDAIRKHVISRAKALGLEAMVPENWNADGSLKTAEKAEEILRTVRSLLPDLAKADSDTDGDGTESEAQDITGAGDAIAAIAKLIISEAESLAAGNVNEACDIGLLLEAVRSLKWFQEREAAEDDANAMELADAAKTDDTSGTNPNTPEDVAPVDKTDKEPVLTKADVADLIKAATAEAGTVAEERITALAADLAKAQATIEELRSMPLPGGPVLTRTSVQQTEARKSDADRLRAEAAAYMAKADLVEDRYLRDGYREKAQELLAKAEA